MIGPMNDLPEEIPDQRKQFRTCGLLLVGASVLLALAVFLFWDLDRERREREYWNLVRHDLRAIHTAMMFFHKNHQRYPTGMHELMELGYLESEPIDLYTKEPFLWEVVDGRPSVVSYGADRLPGGEGHDRDFRSSDFDRREP